MRPMIGAVLATWLLMAPPIDTGWKADVDAGTPMSRWWVVDTYQTAWQCNLMREWRIMTAMRALDSVEDPYRGHHQLKRVRRHKLLIWDYLWECARSDDPRLRNDSSVR